MYQLSELDQNLKIDKYNENYNSDCNNKNLGNKGTVIKTLLKRKII